MPRGIIEATKENTLLFVDANIYLDFYRIRDSELEKKWLDNLYEYAETLIMTEQCYMEILKNRHKAINDSFKQVKKLIEDEKNLKIPAFISSRNSQAIAKHLKSCKNDILNIEKEYAKVLKDRNKDEVFISIKKIIDKIDKRYYLSRSMNGEESIRFEIRDLARKRFELGYPPRKSQDTSFVDGLNWEWIIHCAQKYKKHIVIVTRDTDYGFQFENEFILNDWLKTEFHDRVSTKKKIVTYSRLLLALKFLGLDVSKQDIESEDAIAKQDQIITY